MNVIRVSRDNIGRNRERPREQWGPVVTAWLAQAHGPPLVVTGYGARILGPCRLVYDPHDLTNGLWIETEAEVEVAVEPPGGG